MCSKATGLLTGAGMIGTGKNKQFSYPYPYPRFTRTRTRMGYPNPCSCLLPDTIDLTIPPNFTPSGIKLNGATQALIYAALISHRNLPLTKSAQDMIKTTQQGIQTVTNTLETTRKIWLSTCHPNI